MSDPYNPGSRFRLGSPYGDRRDPFTGKVQFHSGQDFGAAEGTPIPAATPGVVVYSGFNDRLGNTVIVKNPAGYSLYAHMQDGAPRAQEGQSIWPGDTIGHVGSTGARTTGNHLHYSVLKNDASIRHGNAGGKIGVALDDKNTLDPSTYDTAVPYADQTLRAERGMFGPNDTSDALTFRDHGSPVAPAAPAQSWLRSFDRNGSLADRFGDWRLSAPDGAGSSPREPAPQGLPGLVMDYIRRQNEQAGANPPVSAFESGAQAVPFVPDDSEGSFADRFADRPPVRRLTRSYLR